MPEEEYRKHAETVNEQAAEAGLDLQGNPRKPIALGLRGRYLEAGPGLRRELRWWIQRKWRALWANEATTDETTVQVVKRLLLGHMLSSLGCIVLLAVAVNQTKEWNNLSSGQPIFMAFLGALFCAIVCLAFRLVDRGDAYLVYPRRAMAVCVAAVLVVTLFFCFVGEHDGIIIAKAVDGEWVTKQIGAGLYPTSIPLRGWQVFTVTPRCCRQSRSSEPDASALTTCQADAVAYVGTRQVRVYAHVPLRHHPSGVAKMLYLQAHGATFADDYISTHARANVVLKRVLEESLVAFAGKYTEKLPDHIVNGTPEGKLRLAVWVSGLRTHLAVDVPARLAKLGDAERGHVTGISTLVDWDAIHIFKIDHAWAGRKDCSHAGDLGHDEGKCPDQEKPAAASEHAVKSTVGALCTHEMTHSGHPNGVCPDVVAAQSTTSTSATSDVTHVAEVERLQREEAKFRQLQRGDGVRCNHRSELGHMNGERCPDVIAFRTREAMMDVIKGPWLPSRGQPSEKGSPVCTHSTDLGHVNGRCPNTCPSADLTEFGRLLPTGPYRPDDGGRSRAAEVNRPRQR